MPNGRLSLVIFRSACCGIAAAIAALFVWMWGYMVVTAATLMRSHPSGSVEVGWDLVTLAHNTPFRVAVVAVVGFAVGFGLGFRSFSRPARQLITFQRSARALSVVVGFRGESLPALPAVLRAWHVDRRNHISQFRRSARRVWDSAEPRSGGKRR